MKKNILWQDQSGQNENWYKFYKLFYDCIIYFIIIVFVGLFLFLYFFLGVIFYHSFVFISFIILFKLLLNYFIKKQKPICLLEDGILYTNLINNNFIKINEIKSMLLGDYKKVSDFARFINKYGIYFATAFFYFKQFHLTSNFLLGHFISQRKIIKIETQDRVISLFIRDFDGFLNTVKRMGIKFEEKNDIYFYQK